MADLLTLEFFGTVFAPDELHQQGENFCLSIDTFKVKAVNN
jgi:hypothetical protein